MQGGEGVQMVILSRFWLGFIWFSIKITDIVVKSDECHQPPQPGSE